jgi:hypothetical protein
MKTKCLAGILLLLFITGLTGCSDDDNQNNKDRLPETARAFIDSRLPGYSILNIEEVDDNGNESNEKYVVTLSNDITATFSSLGYWRRIESKSELPEKVQDELSYDGAKKVKEKYPSKTINKMYSLLYFYKVILNDDTNLIVYTDNGSEMKIVVGMHDKLSMNKKIYDFVKLNYVRLDTSGRTFEFFQEDENDGSNYRFYMNDGANACFDKDGDWYYADGGRYSIYKEMYQRILPQEVRDIIENKYIGTSSSVCRIIHYETYYKVLLKMGVASTSPFFILYDTTTKTEIEPPTQAVLDFLQTYMGEPNPDMALTSVIKPNPVKNTIYEFTGSINNTKVVVMSVGLDGHMYGITLNGTEIPRKILDYLPAKVKEYVDANISSTDIIISVANGVNDEYYIQFKSGGRLVYDKDGNIVI